MNEKNAKATLLIAEDEEDLRDNYAALLEPLGIEMLMAANGREAFNLLQTNMVHAVLSDISMPDVNGMELLRLTRENDCDVPFLFVSAYGDRQNTLEALRLGANDFIDKPFKASELREKVQWAIELDLLVRKVEQELELATKNLTPEQRMLLRRSRKPLMIFRSELQMLKKTKPAA